MEPVDCPICGKRVQPGKGYRCPECNSFLHPDPLKRLEADMAAKLRRWIIEELPQLGYVLPSDFTLDPEKLETLSFNELTDTIFRVIEPAPLRYIPRDSYPYYLKVLILGEEESGTTEFLQNTIGYYSDTYKSTIGAAFVAKSLAVQSKTGNEFDFKLALWEISPKPRHRNVRSLFISGAQGALIFFNRGQYTTFKHMEDWIREVDQNAGNIPRLLVGFLDARKYIHEAIEVPRHEAEELALDYKMPYLEVTLQAEPQKDSYQQHLNVPYLKLADMILEHKGWEDFAE